MSTLLQLWREVCERSPALVNPQGKHLIVGESDCVLLGCEIERACLPPAPTSIVETLANGWQPIETAPKDGTPIILSNGKVVSSGEWLHDEGGTTEYRDMNGRYVGQRDSDGYDGWIDFSGGMQPAPTHWMPLPTTPTDEVKNA